MDAYTLMELDGGWTRRMLSTMCDAGYITARPFDVHSWNNTNPITQIVKDDYLWERLAEIAGKLTGKNVLRAQVICQQVLWDAQDGPEADGMKKTLRNLSCLVSVREPTRTISTWG